MGARIKEFRLHSFLSFHELELNCRNLNVIIGPNGSGKSNLLCGFKFLNSLQRGVGQFLRVEGGFQEIKRKGSSGHLELEVLIQINKPRKLELRHTISLAGAANNQAVIINESITEEGLKPTPLYMNNPEGPTQIRRNGQLDSIQGIADRESIVKSVSDPTTYPELDSLSKTFRNIWYYPNANTGQGSPLRMPGATDSFNYFLLHDYSNLSLMINKIEYLGGKNELTGYLQKFTPNIEDVLTVIEGGTIQLFIRERGLSSPTPARRLSDGLLRYLCLLAILLHPNPPPVICIEEPELGMHPDILPVIAELLEKASERTQLFVTTHSPGLISALSDPESVLVCEKTESEGTMMRRLSAEDLGDWLEKYTLGTLWQMGEIGGTL